MNAAEYSNEQLIQPVSPVFHRGKITNKNNTMLRQLMTSRHICIYKIQKKKFKTKLNAIQMLSLQEHLLIIQLPKLQQSHFNF